MQSMGGSVIWVQATYISTACCVAEDSLLANSVCVCGFHIVLSEHQWKEVVHALGAEQQKLCGNL